MATQFFPQRSVVLRGLLSPWGATGQARRCTVTALLPSYNSSRDVPEIHACLYYREKILPSTARGLSAVGGYEGNFE